MPCRFFSCFGLFALTLGFSAGVFANDNDAREKIEEAVLAERSQDYFGAANLYKDALLLADDTTLKANALKAASDAFRNGKWYYKEFECNEDLIRGFPNHINYTQTVDRQFLLGDEYYAGYRQPASEWLRWSWLTGKNHCIDIYTKALEHGPFSPRAPQSKLRLARLLIERNEKGDVDKGLTLLRETSKDYPGTLEQKYAYLELMNILTQKALRGDASEEQTDEAREIMHHFFLIYPNDPEIPWVKDALIRLDDASARRLMNIAEYYRRIRNDAGVAHELKKLMRKYPNTESAQVASVELGELQPSIIPPAALPLPDSVMLMKPAEIFHERRDILCVPANSDGKWLLPIEDYSWDLSRNRAEHDERLKKEENLRHKAIPGGGKELPKGEKK